MNGRPDMTMRMLAPSEIPEGRLCKTGHRAKRCWVDVGGNFHPNRFFMVTGKTLDEKRHGVYCEECLVVAGQMAKAAKAS